MAAWLPPGNGAITPWISWKRRRCSRFFAEKCPRLRARQGQYAVIAAGGLILKRGPDLAQVLKVFDKKILKALAAE
jgi:hypothetical protein